MSLRCNRSVIGRHSLKKATARKKPQVRQAWDSSVQDLSVHRATPEELAQRHEMHKSKNQRLAQRELHEKSLKKKWRKQNGGSADPLEERRLALMMEILSDQYQMKDVLERSDRTLAVVKDLFGDAPCRRTGFPNITMAPSCDLETSRGPIAQKRDPPTRLAILSESVMDSQALNEVDVSRSEDSDDDGADVSISFQPGLTTDRAHQILNEGTPHPGTPHQSAVDADHQFVTPKGLGPPRHGQTALNATTAVKKVKTRLTEEEKEEAEDPQCVIGRILNPNPPKPHRVPSKGKKNRSCRAPPVCGSAALSSCSQSSLDVLNHMMQEVDQELEDYARQGGREVDTVPKGQGLAGFTMSLVCSIRRLVTYLKEGDQRWRQEVAQRRRLQEDLDEQRSLIDALTAEILSMKELCTPTELSQRSLSAHSLTPPVEILHASPAAKPEQRRTAGRSSPAPALSLATHLGLQDMEDKMPSPASLEDAADVNSLLGFQAAILLSPPRQRTRGDYSHHDASLRTETERPETKDVPESCSNVSESSSIDRRSGLHQNQRKGQDSVKSPQFRSSHPSPSDLKDDEYRAEQQLVTTDVSLCGDNMAARMAQLILQNNVLKARLKELDCNTAGSGSLAKPADGGSLVKPADGGTSMQTGAETKGASLTPRTPMTLKQRIAELNRQSAEARNKLLGLIEQQKQSAVVSPAISPITPQGEDSGSRGRMQAGIPMLSFTDSSIEVTPSPHSRGSSSGRRSNASSVSGECREGRGAGGGAPWRKVGRQKEEGWFALTTHVS